MPQVPSMADVMRMMQAQTDALATLPDTLTELSRALEGLTETIALAHETVAAAHEVVTRANGVLEELEVPVQELRASLEAVNVLLKHPVVDRVPATLEAVESIVLPIARTSARARARTARVAAFVRRLRSSDRPA